MPKNYLQTVTVLEWLYGFTSIVGHDESAEMAVHFVRFRLIALVSDKSNNLKNLFMIRGNVPTACFGTLHKLCALTPPC